MHLRIEIPGKLRIEFRGPTKHPHVGLSQAQGRVNVSRSDALVTFEGDSAKAETPAFFEDTRYRIAFQSLCKERDLAISARSPEVISDIDFFDSAELLTASINFGRSVGLSKLTFRAGATVLDVEVEVFPTKLDYAADFSSILYEVSTTARGLALEYLRSTYLKGGGEAAESPATIEWLILLRNEIDALVQALNQVARHPHRSLGTTEQLVKADRVRSLTSGVRRAITRGSGVGPFRNVSGAGSFRARESIPYSVRVESDRTPEHAWLRHQLDLVISQLNSISLGIQKELQGARTTGRATKRLEAEKAEINKFLGQLESVRRLPIFSSASTVPPAGPPSLTLLNGLGYRESYRALMTIRMGLDIRGDLFEFSVKELHALYEVWCFIQLAAVVGELTALKGVSGDLFATTNGLRVNLKQGKQSEIAFRSASREVALVYNPTFPGLTGNQRPDIVLEVRENDWPKVIVVFDAKYRLQSDDSYVKSFGIPGPPVDAVNALHRYRDAIVVGSGTGRGRPTVKGIALFPLPAQLRDEFANSGLYAAIEQLGVGALPFTPSVKGPVKEWLSSLLDLPMKELVDPGPPFLGYEHARN